MVALEVCSDLLTVPPPQSGPADQHVADVDDAPFIAVVNAAGETVAYVPEDMGHDCARAHAALIAEAGHLRDLTLFAAEELSERSHPGLMRAFRGYCQSVLDRIDDAIVIS